MSDPARTRIVVTGIGVVSAWGWGVGPFWNGIRSNRSGVGPFGRWDHADYPTHVAGEVPDPPEELPRSIANWKRLSQADRFAVAAAREAVTHARFPAGLPPSAGVFFSSSTGGMFESESFYARLRGAAAGRPSLRQMSSQQVSCPGEAVARNLGLGGPVETVSSACASGALAIGMALDALQTGEVPIALAGGADSLCRVTYGGFNALQAVDGEPSRPFRKDRAGLSLGEGGAALVLETVDGAAARGARPLAELISAGASGDAYHMTAPRPDGSGAAAALRQALDRAGLSPERVTWVNAHGTGTELNDRAEWNALRDVLGPRADQVPITSTKASVGHLLGSAGALEAVATVLCVDHGVVHPTPGGGTVDPETPVALATEERDLGKHAGIAASLNLAFGGCNAALLFARPEEARR